MAYMCDSEDGTPGFTVMTNQTTGDVTVLCAPCLVDFCWQMIQEAPDYEDRIRGLLLAVAEKDANSKSRAETRRRRKAINEGEEGKDTTVGAVAADTPEEPTDQ